MAKTTTLGALGAAALLALAGCGGEDTPIGGGGGGGTLTLSAANPALENTTIDLSKAGSSGNDARAADAFSPTPYCEIFAEGAPGANGRVYAVQVYFRQSDQAVLHASVIGSANSAQPPTYAVFDNNGGNPITGIAVNIASKTVTFTNKVLAGIAGELGTLNGSATFPANGTNVAGCGV